MKPTVFLASTAALIAVAGCNSNEGNAATNTPVELTQVAAPKNGDWRTIVQATPAGGFLMGNPNAKVKLIEYGSMTCPHCKEFDESGVGPLIDTYVKSGQVSYEFRNYVRDGVDLTASLIARCNGPKGFFPLTRALYADQENWFATIQAAPEDKMQSIQSLPPTQQFLEVAKVAGFQNYAAMRGIPIAKSTQCLTDQASIDQLVAMNSQATTDFPNFAGTPTFILNGSMLEKTATWKDLEPQIKSALGG
jgi:protein-disulfide isomerase